MTHVHTERSVMSIIKLFFSSKPFCFIYSKTVLKTFLLRMTLKEVVVSVANPFVCT